MLVHSRTLVLDPNELAAKGATLLHHLALWMIEEKKVKEVEAAEKSLTQTQPTVSGSCAVPGNHRHRGSECDRPDSGFDSKDEDETKNVSISQQQQQRHERHESETVSEKTSGGVTLRHVSATISEENCRASSDASSSSSPDNVAEISRQAPIRQPIFRKRRIQMN